VNFYFSIWCDDVTTICTLQNLGLTFPHKTIFKNASFNLKEGDRVGVLGLNGHGKSSLFHIMTDSIKPDTTIPPFLYDRGRDFSVFLVPQELPLHKGVNMTDYFYEFFPALKKLKLAVQKVEEEMGHVVDDDKLHRLIDEQSKIYEALEKANESTLHGRYVSYLKYFGLEQHEREVAVLSGGEQRKVALSLGLSAPQSVILWDEPTNHLDLSTIELFEEELGNCDKTFMIISHDRELLNNVVDRIIHIQRGQIRSYSGTYAQYITFLQEQELSRLKAVDKLSNYQRRETAWISRGAKARRTKSKKRIDDYAGLNERLRELRSQQHAKVSISLKSTQRQTKVLVQTEDVAFAHGKRQLLKNLNLTLAKGEKIALIGDNGTGKSTLLNLLMGVLTPTAGTIKRPEQLTFGYFSQKRETLNPEITPWQLLGKGIDFVISNTGDKRHVAGYLESFLFSSEEIKRPIKTFSGGEKNRLQLALFMKDAQDVWIFDEPTNDLDLETIGVLEEELKNYQGALIVVGHDRAFLENVTDKCWLLIDGGIMVFEAGLAQAMAYREVRAIEDKIKALESRRQDRQQTNSTPDQTPVAKEKMTPKEKKRLQTIEQDIHQCEEKMANAQTFISAFDYAAADRQAHQKLSDSQTQLKALESELEQLMDEWSRLEAKNK
jgi:ATP-binding cassette subfamily F protein uup